MRLLKGFGTFWYDFIVGDDWKIAAAVVAALAGATAFALSGLPAAVAGGGLLVLFFVGSMVIDVRNSG